MYSVIEDHELQASVEDIATKFERAFKALRGDTQGFVCIAL